MKARVLFAAVAAGISMLHSAAPPAQSHRLGPADIYPDPIRTPGAANPQVTQRNIGDTNGKRIVKSDSSLPIEVTKGGG